MSDEIIEMISLICRHCGRRRTTCQCAELERLRMQLMEAGSEIERLTKENVRIRMENAAIAQDIQEIRSGKRF